MDELVSSPEILAVEVCVGNTRPPEFSGGCGGAMVVWTGAG